MFLYVGGRRVWVTNITRCVDVDKKTTVGYILRCKESPCCSVPFDVNVYEDSTIQLCDEHGFRKGKRYTGEMGFVVIENMKTELLLDKL